MGVKQSDMALMVGNSGMSASFGQIITLHHTMYNVKAKTKAQIEKSLELHIQYLEKQHPGHSYNKSSYEELNNGNEIKFRIEMLKKC